MTTAARRRMTGEMTFAQAAESHLDDVYGYLAWFTGDRAAADELAGETFERALRLWHRFDPRRGSARTWLCQVARTVALDHFRSERRRTRREELAAVPERFEEQFAEGLSPDWSPRCAALTAGEREVIALRVVLELDAGTAPACSASRPPTARRASTGRSRSSRRPSMSQRDLVAELRGARIAAPAELRERVRADRRRSHRPAAPRSRWRRALVVALPVAAAVAAAISSRGRRTSRPAVTPPPVGRQARDACAAQQRRAKTFGTPSGARRAEASRPGRPARRAACSATARPRAARPTRERRLRRRQARTADRDVARRLSRPRCTPRPRGEGRDADLVLRIPRAHVQEAISRLSALGTITGEQVDVQDLQAGLERDRPDDRAAAEAARDAARADAEPTASRNHRRARRPDRAPPARTRPRHDPHRALRDGAAAPDDPPAAAPHQAGHGPLHGLGVAFTGSGSAPSTHSRSARRCRSARRSSGSAARDRPAPARGRAAQLGLDLGEHPERRLADRQLARTPG